MRRAWKTLDWLWKSWALKTTVAWEQTDVWSEYCSISWIVRLNIKWILYSFADICVLTNLLAVLSLYTTLCTHLGIFPYYQCLDFGRWNGRKWEDLKAGVIFGQSNQNICYIWPNITRLGFDGKIDKWSRNFKCTDI